MMPSFRWGVFAFLLLACAAFAQPQRFEIRGVVTASGGGDPIAGAEVKLWKSTRPPAPPPWANQTPIAETTTDFAGRFRFTPGEAGDYVMLAEKAGFVRTRVFGAKLTPEKPLDEVRYELVAAAQVTGRVVDDDSGRAVSNLRLWVMGSHYNARGHRSFYLGKTTATDQDGRFSVEVTPGDYVVRTYPRSWSDKPSGPFRRVLTEFKPEDADAVEDDYPTTYFPGVTDVSAAITLTVRAGDLQDIGQLAVRRTPHYRARVSFPPGACDSRTGAVLAMMSNELGNGMDEVGQPPCGRDFLIRGLLPGEYTLDVTAPGGSPGRSRAAVTFAIVDRNAAVMLPFAVGVPIDGRIVAAESEAKLPLENVYVSLRPAMGPSFADEAPAKPNREGIFRFVNVAPAAQRFGITGLPANVYVKAVRYNGSAISDGIVPVNPVSPAHSLEIVVSDQPATIGGAVVDHDRPVSRAIAVLVPLPVPTPAVRGATIVHADDQGRFQMTQLPPGEYRLLALPPTAAGELPKPGVLDGLMSRGEKVNLTPGMQEFTVKLTELR